MASLSTSTNRTADLNDTKVDIKVVLSGLWISMLFVLAYVDIFGCWRADVISGALAGEIPGPGFEIGERFLARNWPGPSSHGRASDV